MQLCVSPEPIVQRTGVGVELRLHGGDGIGESREALISGLAGLDQRHELLCKCFLFIGGLTLRLNENKLCQQVCA